MKQQWETQTTVQPPLEDGAQAETGRQRLKGGATLALPSWPSRQRRSDFGSLSIATSIKGRE